MTKVHRKEKDACLPLIFDEPDLKIPLNKLFTSLDPEIRNRFDEITEFLKSDVLEIHKNLSYENILSLFKSNFYEAVLKEATHMASVGKNNYNILTNAISLVTEENLRNAIMGKNMIDSFVSALRSIPLGPNESGLVAALIGSKIFLLEKKFLGNKYFSPFAIKTDNPNEMNNYCGDCGCSCTCNADCEGDPKKCTCATAIAKNCTHHCTCYATIIAKSFRGMWPPK